MMPSSVMGFEVLGLGEGLPLACNDTAWGQNQKPPG